MLRRREVVDWDEEEAAGGSAGGSALRDEVVDVIELSRLSW